MCNQAYQEQQQESKVQMEELKKEVDQLKQEVETRCVCVSVSVCLIDWLQVLDDFFSPYRPTLKEVKFYKHKLRRLEALNKHNNIR